MYHCVSKFFFFRFNMIITDKCYRFNIYMLFFHNRNLKYAFSLELIPKKQALITKCFACQKITPYLIVKNKILHYTEKKGDLFASIRKLIKILLALCWKKRYWDTRYKRIAINESRRFYKLDGFLLSIFYSIC